MCNPSSINDIHAAHMVHKKGIFKDICSKSFEIDLTNDQPDKFDEIGRLMKLK